MRCRERSSNEIFKMGLKGILKMGLQGYNSAGSDIAPLLR